MSMKSEKKANKAYKEATAPKSQAKIELKEGYLYDPVAQKQRKATDEEFVRQEMIRTLVNEYGYPLTSMETEFPVKLGSATKKVDIAIFPDESAHKQEIVTLIIECKKPKVKITDRQDGVGQLISYVSACPACDFGLWTNGAGFERQVIHRISPKQVKLVDYDIPRHGQAKPPDKAPKLEDLTPATTESLKWRFRKCHNIIAQSGDDKMTAFWEFLKVIQTKIEDEKEDKERAGFFATPSETETQDGQTRVMNRITKLYRRLVVPKFGQLGFQGDKINIRPAILARIVSELQDYSLLTTGPTVKGAAYEEIVGANLRGDKGEFFTPRVVVEAAVDMIQVMPDGLCCDPACGSGGFSVMMLVSGMQAMSARYSKRRGEWGDTIRDEQRKFALSNVVSNDINRNLANAARMNMLMNNDGSGLVFDQDILEPPHNWTCENADLLRKKISLTTKNLASHTFMVGDVTALCTNPPFGNDITRTERHVLDQFDLGRGKSFQIVEILFIERCVQLLRPGKGRAAIIVPQSILNNPGLEYVRKWILLHTRVLAVVELPVETFLISGREGTGTLTAILLVERRDLDEVVATMGGAPTDPYPIFMAIADNVGYDRRGKTTYRKEKDGTDIVKDVPLIDLSSGRTLRVSKERIVANDLPHIVADYLKFRREFAEGKVHFDKAEGIYRVI
jgi:type I restriction enzyme M protein